MIGELKCRGEKKGKRRNKNGQGGEKKKEGKKKEKENGRGRSVKCAAINLTLYARQKINALSNFINSSLHNEPRGERITFLNATIMPPRTSAL